MSINREKEEKEAKERIYSCLFGQDVEFKCDRELFAVTIKEMLLDLGITANFSRIWIKNQLYNDLFHHIEQCLIDDKSLADEYGKSLGNSFFVDTFKKPLCLKTRLEILGLYAKKRFEEYKPDNDHDNGHLKFVKSTSVNILNQLDVDRDEHQIYFSSLFHKYSKKIKFAYEVFSKNNIHNNISTKPCIPPRREQPRAPPRDEPPRCEPPRDLPQNKPPCASKPEWFRTPSCSSKIFNFSSPTCSYSSGSRSSCSSYHRSSHYSSGNRSSRYSSGNRSSRSSYHSSSYYSSDSGSYYSSSKRKNSSEYNDSGSNHPKKSKY